MGRYSRLFLRAFLEANRVHEVHFLLNGAFPNSVMALRNEFCSFLSAERFHLFHPVGQVFWHRETNFERRELSIQLREAVIRSIRPELLLITGVVEGYDDNVVMDIAEDRDYRVAAILYDLIPLAMKDLYLSDSRYKAFYLEKVDLYHRCDALLAISKHTMDEAIQYLGIPKDRISEIGAGVGLNAQVLVNPAPVSSLRRLGIFKPYVLYAPGGYDPRKNVTRLLQGWARLPRQLRESYQLVFGSRISSRSLVLEPAAKVGLHDGRDFVITNYVEDEVLVRLYRDCTVMAFPSLYEGFGLPVLEAMVCGAPVIGSNVSSLPEVLGTAEAEFDPYNADSIASKLTSVLSDSQTLDRLKLVAASQVEKFSWAITAEKTLAHLMLLDSPGLTVPPIQAVDLEPVFRLVDHHRSGLGRDDFIRLSVSSAPHVAREGLPRLFVDVSALVTHDAKTGIQRVVRSMLQYLPEKVRNSYQVEPVYGDSSHRYRHLRDWGSGRAAEDPTIDPRSGDIFLGLDLSAHLFPAYRDELIRFRALGLKVAFVVYDIIPLMHPRFCDDGLVQAFNVWAAVISRYSDQLLCISQSVRDEVENWIAENVPQTFPRPHLDWFHLGADIQASRPTTGMPQDADQVLAKLRARPSYLMVGTLEPRKGHRFAVEAFDKLWSDGVDVNLVLVGKLGWKMETFAKELQTHPEFGHRLFWLQGISDEYLDQIYDAAKSLVAASEAEGFGLPIIEAAQRKKHVIVRDIPVFREVAGSAGTYFSGEHPDSLAAAIVADLQASVRPISDGSGVRWQTWEEATEQLISRLLPR